MPRDWVAGEGDDENAGTGTRREVVVEGFGGVASAESDAMFVSSRSSTDAAETLDSTVLPFLDREGTSVAVALVGGVGDVCLIVGNAGSDAGGDGSSRDKLGTLSAFGASLLLSEAFDVSDPGAFGNADGSAGALVAFANVSEPIAKRWLESLMPGIDIVGAGRYAEPDETDFEGLRGLVGASRFSRGLTTGEAVGEDGFDDG